MLGHKLQIMCPFWEEINVCVCYLIEVLPPFGERFPNFDYTSSQNQSLRFKTLSFDPATKPDGLHSNLN